MANDVTVVIVFPRDGLDGEITNASDCVAFAPYYADVGATNVAWISVEDGEGKVTERGVVQLVKGRLTFRRANTAANTEGTDNSVTSDTDQNKAG
jgi:hypothetical protein